MIRPIDTPLLKALGQIVANAFQASGLPSNGVSVVRAKIPNVDFQCNDSFRLAHVVPEPARNIAARVAETLKSDERFTSVEASGPGFINIKLSESALSEVANAQLRNPKDSLKTECRQTVLIDFGGPNIAKPLHVGHLRSLVIGESLRRIFIALGHRVFSDVHLGDWGLQIGMLIGEIRRQFPELVCFLDDFATNSEKSNWLHLTNDDLQTMYPNAAIACKRDSKRLDEARADTVALQAGSPVHLALWREIRRISLNALVRDFAMLDVHFDTMRGESDVQQLIPELITRFTVLGIAHPNEGALVVDVAYPSDSRSIPPLLLTKSDGAALYATTDLATIVDRTRSYAGLNQIIYVVDSRQELHFEQVFRSARKAGIATGVTLIHAGFGTVNGSNGKPYRTRQGDVPSLNNLLQEAIAKARDRLSVPGDCTAEMDSFNLPEQRRQSEFEDLARMVGIGALKFADLSTYRTKGYEFDVTKMTAFNGRTGPYIQYACVRIRAILDRAEHDELTGKISSPFVDAERALLLECASFPDIVRSAAEHLAPNEVADFAYRLAQSFTTFYSTCPVLAAKTSHSRISRLALCSLTLHTMEHATALLGIATPKRM